MCEWLDKVEEKVAVEIAKALIEMGDLALEKIAQATKLPLEKVQELAGVKPA